jgi:hypothetical protein
MDEREFERIIAELPRTFRSPAEPPYDEMWRAVEASHFDSAARRTALRKRALSVVPWLAVAAALFVGIGIGRVTRHSIPATAAEASTPAKSSGASAAAETYRDETTRYLEQAAALLIALPNPTGPDRFTSASGNTRLADKASDLLVTTRLLLDSPAAQDPKLHSLLEDLELVFAQIARLRVEKSRSDLDLIHQAVEQGNVLTRLNSVVAANPSAE